MKINFHNLLIKLFNGVYDSHHQAAKPQWNQNNFPEMSHHAELVNNILKTRYRTKAGRVSKFDDSLFVSVFQRKLLHPEHDKLVSSISSHLR